MDRHDSCRNNGYFSSKTTKLETHTCLHMSTSDLGRGFKPETYQSKLNYQSKWVREQYLHLKQKKYCKQQ